MTGDIGPAAIQSLLDAPPPELAQGVDIMELPHHGSVNEPSQRLTLSLNPRAVLQSTGKARAQDPRWNHVREGRTWLSTAEVGAAWVEIGTDGRLTAGWWGE
jgi:beta-lactamase superfamily II metal-dependent hydrolase